MSGTPVILALDLATRIGWACWKKGHAPHYGSHKLPSAQLPNGGVDLGRFASAYSLWLQDMIKAFGVTAMAFEAPILPGNTQIATARKLMGLAVMTEYIGNRLGLRYFEVRAPEARKWFFGKGGGKRSEMKSMAVEECHRRGFQPKSDDEADALCVLDFAAHCLGLETDWPGRGAGPLFQTKEQVAARR